MLLVDKFVPGLRWSDIDNTNDVNMIWHIDTMSLKESTQVGDQTSGPPSTDPAVIAIVWLYTILHAKLHSNAESFQH